MPLPNPYSSASGAQILPILSPSPNYLKIMLDNTIFRCRDGQYRTWSDVESLGNVLFDEKERLILEKTPLSPDKIPSVPPGKTLMFSIGIPLIELPPPPIPAEADTSLSEEELTNQLMTIPRKLLPPSIAKDLPPVDDIALNYPMANNLARKILRYTGGARSFSLPNNQKASDLIRVIESKIGWTWSMETTSQFLTVNNVWNKSLDLNGYQVLAIATIVNSLKALLFPQKDEDDLDAYLSRGEFGGYAELFPQGADWTRGHECY